MSWLLWLEILDWLIRITMLLVILRRKGSTTARLAWLTIVFFEPHVGLVLYLLVGENHLGRRRASRHLQAVASVLADPRVVRQHAHALRPPIEAALTPLVLQAEKTGGFRILGGNHIQLLAEMETLADQLVADIDAAREHVHLLYYIIAGDETGRRVGQALQRAVARGVRCRLLADAVGSWGFFSRGGLAAQLRAAGVEVHEMLPVSFIRRRLERLDLRNHRKLAIIDGRIGYAGSHNLVNPSVGSKRGGSYVDLTGRFRGPVVSQLQLVFLEDWAYETHEDLETPDILPFPEPHGTIAAQVVPTGPSHEDEAFPRVLLSAIHSATRKLIITTPYLVPDEPTLLGLAMAVDRGVEVNIVLPERSDQRILDAAARSHIGPLLDSGVRIYLHREGMLHAKTMTVDDSFALLGSANLDVRSFYLNFEASVLLYGAEITHSLRFAQSRYIAESIRVTQATWSQRTAVWRYVDQAVSLVSPLL